MIQHGAGLGESESSLSNVQFRGFQQQLNTIYSSLASPVLTTRGVSPARHGEADEVGGIRIFIRDTVIMKKHTRHKSAKDAVNKGYDNDTHERRRQFTPDTNLSNRSRESSTWCQAPSLPIGEQRHSPSPPTPPPGGPRPVGVSSSPGHHSPKRSRQLRP